MCVSPAFKMMGDKVSRSVEAKVRTEFGAIPLGVRDEPSFFKMGEVVMACFVKRTRLFVVVIVLDAFSGIIFLSLDLDLDR